MTDKLLIIDPQNDFCDIEGAALPVSGAQADMSRISQFLSARTGRLDEVIVTLDSHPTVAIERTTFWQGAAGVAVPPFTVISYADLKLGRYAPRNAALLPHALAYLRELEERGHHQLMIWPVHCVVGTWGHNIHSELLTQITSWEVSRNRNAFKVLKGEHPLTEQYSAVQAEVQLREHPATHANLALIERARPTDGLLYVTGEAASHCVAATVMDLLSHFTKAERERVVLLADCMSPVAGFAATKTMFFHAAEDAGVIVTSSAAVL